MKMNTLLTELKQYPGHPRYKVINFEVNLGDVVEYREETLSAKTFWLVMVGLTVQSEEC